MEGFTSKGATRVLYMPYMQYFIYMCAVLNRKSNEMTTKKGELKDYEGLPRVEIES